MALGLNDVDVDGIKELDGRSARTRPSASARSSCARPGSAAAKALVEIGSQQVRGKESCRRRGASSSRGRAAVPGRGGRRPDGGGSAGGRAGRLRDLRHRHQRRRSSTCRSTPSSIEMEADIDFRGLLGHDKSVRNGFTRHPLHRHDPEPGIRGPGPPVQGDHRPQVPGARHAGEPGHHHVEVCLQAELRVEGAGRDQLHLHEGADPLRGEGGRARRASPPYAASRGDSRDYLMADHNWIPLAIADEMVKVCQQLLNETDEERWARRYGESSWTGSQRRGALLPRHLLHGDREPPRRLRARRHDLRAAEPVLSARHPGGGRAHGRGTIGRRGPATACRAGRAAWLKVQIERFPTNWGLPRATIHREHVCRAGATSVPLEDPVAQPFTWAVASGRPAWPERPGRSALAAPARRRRRARGPSPPWRPFPLVAGSGARATPCARAPAAPHPAAARPAIRGDHHSRPRAGEEVRASWRRGSSSCRSSRPQRRSERHPRPGEDLRPGALDRWFTGWATRAAHLFRVDPAARRAPRPPHGRR